MRRSRLRHRRHVQAGWLAQARERVGVLALPRGRGIAVTVSAAGAVGWLLAEGTETATTEGREEKHPYRMSVVCEKRDGRWLLLQIQFSGPS